MTDELVMKLRLWGVIWPEDVDKPEGHLYQEAADRIEQLVAIKEELEAEAKIQEVILDSIIEGRNATFALMLKRAETAEAKLAKVIILADAMAEAIEDQIDTCDASMDEQIAVKNYRATLAELTGEE